MKRKILLSIIFILLLMPLFAVTINVSDATAILTLNMNQLDSVQFGFVDSVIDSIDDPINTEETEVDSSANAVSEIPLHLSGASAVSDKYYVFWKIRSTSPFNGTFSWGEFKKRGENTTTISASVTLSGLNGSGGVEDEPVNNSVKVFSHGGGKTFTSAGSYGFTISAQELKSGYFTSELTLTVTSGA